MTVGVGVALVRLASLLAGVMLAPRAPRLRLVRVKNPQAKALLRWIRVAAILIAAGLLLPDLAERIGGAMQVATTLRTATLLGVAALLVATVAAVDKARRRRDALATPALPPWPRRCPAARGCAPCRARSWRRSGWWRSRSCGPAGWSAGR